MRITNKDLAAHEGMRGRDISREIGDIGEEIINGVLTDNGIPHSATDVNCHIDILVPSRKFMYGIEVKTVLSLSRRRILMEDHGVSKKSHCRIKNLKPLTIVLRNIPGTNDFLVLWKYGIKEFELDRMHDIETFFDIYQPPMFHDGKHRPFRCPMCGRYASLNGHRYDPIKISPVPAMAIDLYGIRDVYRDAKGNRYIDERVEYARVNIICPCEGNKIRPTGWILQRTGR